ncbi:Homoserine dehydrogenase (EC [Olavius algarvensis associated proteobacterium Delta 3]|nr:Homoserine dehydrogenase (EC [Olavius algarvensis associated proteobacterium Delta 3]
MKKINIGLLGFGTVGTGVARILLEERDLLRARAGVDLNLKYVADIDLTTDRGVALPAGVLIDDAQRVIHDPEVDIVLEMIGGKGIAKDMMLAAIRKGKHVVTANKALLASHGNEIVREASENGVNLAFEASTGGCMPVIKTLRESLVGNRISGMIGILNGTCNYILTKISDEGCPFAEALAEAQTKGYAEADPTLDVEGLDTAHKLAILNSLAYGMEINLNDIYVEGIPRITPMDIEFASEFGYRIKLLAISKDKGEAIEARIHPTMIPFDNLLSNVNGTVNAITFSCSAADDILLYGRGAGMMPTASAVVADIVDLARNMLSCAGVRVPMLSCQMENIKDIPIMPVEDIKTHYYFRFAALDRPGVLSKIAGILGNHQISIKSVHQKGRKTDGAVPIVMLTHRAVEKSVSQALSKITALDVVADKPILIRIEDDDREE